MQIIEVNDPYTIGSAFGFKVNPDEIAQFSRENNPILNQMLTDNARTFYQSVDNLNNYLNSDAIMNDIETVTNSMSDGVDYFKIYSYDEDTYMNITPYMKQVIMTNPYLHKEFVEGNINGFGSEDDRYDEELYKSIVGGVGDHLNDTEIYVDSSDMETGIETYDKVQTVWAKYINALDNDDDFTDI